MPNDERSIIRTIRLDPRKLASMLEATRDDERNNPVDDDRGTDRVWLTKRVLITFKGKHSSANHYEAFVRNISATGISIVLGVYIYPDTPCAITIHTSSGEQQVISGQVNGCRHLTAMIHEIGIDFASEIEIGEFVEGHAGNFSAGADTRPDDIANARGRILIIEDSIPDQRLLRHALEESKLELTFVVNGAEAIEKINDFPTLVICDQNLPDTNGIMLIKQMRDAGYPGQVLMITGEESEDLKTEALRAGAMGTIVKPWTPRELRTRILEALEKADNSPLHGTLPIVSTADPEKMPAEIILEFVDSLDGIADAIQTAIDPFDRETLRASALTVKSSALGYGFAPLTHAASRVVHGIDEGEEDDEVITIARVLLSTCRRATVPDKWRKNAA